MKPVFDTWVSRKIIHDDHKLECRKFMTINEILSDNVDSYKLKNDWYDKGSQKLNYYL